jgi:hypothetical protein
MFKLSFLSALLISVLLATSASAKKCTSDEQHRAFNIKSLQTEFMVYALSCKQNILYNNFVTNFQGYLVNQDKVIKSYFSNNSDTKNKFMTSLANRSSKRTLMQPIKEYCSSIKPVFSYAVENNKKSLLMLAEQDRFATLHNIEPCNKKEVASNTNILNINKFSGKMKSLFNFSN